MAVAQLYKAEQKEHSELTVNARIPTAFVELWLKPCRVYSGGVHIATLKLKVTIKFMSVWWA